MASLFRFLLMLWLPPALMLWVWGSTDWRRPRVVLTAALVGLLSDRGTPLIIRLRRDGLWPRSLVLATPLVWVLVLVFVIIFLFLLRPVRFLQSFYLLWFLWFLSFLSVSLLSLHFTLGRLRSKEKIFFRLPCKYTHMNLLYLNSLNVLFEESHSLRFLRDGAIHLVILESRPNLLNKEI